MILFVWQSSQHIATRFLPQQSQHQKKSILKEKRGAEQHSTISLKEPCNGRHTDTTPTVVWAITSPPSVPTNFEKSWDYRLQGGKGNICGMVFSNIMEPLVLGLCTMGAALEAYGIFCWINCFQQRRPQTGHRLRPTAAHFGAS